ncbi:MAG: hypothetical protein ACM34K_06545 [Bacillota bacterium]
MTQIILGGVISSVLAALIISGFRWISKTLTKGLKNLQDDLSAIRLKADYLEIKHEALVLALHDHFHNGFYINYQNELERLSNDYKFVNEVKS